MLSVPGAAHFRISAPHWIRAMTGTMTSVPPRTSPSRSAASAMSSGRASAAGAAALPRALAEGGGAFFHSRLGWASITEMACRVLPIPISSARMPPRSRPASCAHIHARPSFWYGSIGARSVSGGSRDCVHDDAAASTSVSGSTACSPAGPSTADSIAITFAVSASVSMVSMPKSLEESASAFSQKSVGRRLHSRCCQRVMMPHPFSSTSSPIRNARCAISSPHAPHLARPVLAYSTLYVPV
mmetsp:Transcript_8822/g.29127  ORF Transcript_8822/g.29127 Transcript_8822/m.29127 type:complete len:242 (+) Transcript_8822:1897-2622(+)